MKALYCSACGAIIGLPQDTQVWGCRCKRVYARWIDPERGICQFAEFAEPFIVAHGGEPLSLDEPEHAWLLGIHNAILQGAFRREPRGPNYLEYRSWQDADGTLFKTYESMIVRVRPGGTSDSTFVSMDELRQGA
jgi:hypothetical protein